MVPTPSSPRNPVTDALARAFERAKSERLVCFRIVPGVWACKVYTIVETGERPHEVACNCVAGQRGLTCKHAACVTFCRKHHVSPIRPVPASDAGLQECYGTVPVH